MRWLVAYHYKGENVIRHIGSSAVSSSVSGYGNITWSTSTSEISDLELYHLKGFILQKLDYNKQISLYREYEGEYLDIKLKEHREGLTILSLIPMTHKDVVGELL
ncbi:MAG: hypothetical protein ACO1O1_13205 [Adhaeribacter sp.]